MSTEPHFSSALSSELLKSLTDAVRGLEFGEIHLTVHEGRVVSIERTEKIRLNRPPALRRSDPARVIPQ